MSKTIRKDINQLSDERMHIGNKGIVKLLNQKWLAITKPNTEQLLQKNSFFMIFCV